jgi:hypothetical protein
MRATFRVTDVRARRAPAGRERNRRETRLRGLSDALGAEPCPAPFCPRLQGGVSIPGAGHDGAAGSNVAGGSPQAFEPKRVDRPRWGEPFAETAFAETAFTERAPRSSRHHPARISERNQVGRPSQVDKMHELASAEELTSENST